MAGNAYHIIKKQRGGWDVKRTGASRSSAHTATKAEAVKTATKMLENTGGGEIIVQLDDGRVMERKMYVLKATGGSLKLTPATVELVHRDAQGRALNPDGAPASKNGKSKDRSNRESR